MKEGMRKATKAESFKIEAVEEKKTKLLRPVGRRHASWPLSHSLCVLGWEESF
jgi:hypothetical protein